MGNWYFVRQHPIYAASPVNQGTGLHNQPKGRRGETGPCSSNKHPDGRDIEIHRRLPPGHDRKLAPVSFPHKMADTKILYTASPIYTRPAGNDFIANRPRLAPPVKNINRKKKRKTLRAALSVVDPGLFIAAQDDASA